MLQILVYKMYSSLIAVYNLQNRFTQLCRFENMWLEMLFSVYIVFRCREWVEKYIRFISFTCDWLLIANINLRKHEDESL